jgi:hypothetical protein
MLLYYLTIILWVEGRNYVGDATELNESIEED